MENNTHDQTQVLDLIEREEKKLSISEASFLSFFPFFVMKTTLNYKEGFIEVINDSLT